MRKNAKQQNKVLMFLLMFLSEDVMIFSTNMDRRYFWFRNIAVMIITLWLLYTYLRNNRMISRNVVLAASLLILNVILTMSVNQDIDNRFIYNIVIIVLAAMVVSRLTVDEFISSYCNCMKVFAIASLIEYAIFLIAYPITTLAPQVVNLSGARFSNWFLTISLNKEFYFVMPYRNWGIYREPGVYMCFLILALIFEMFLMKKKRSNILLFFATLVTTFSTGGFIVGALLLLIYVMVSIDKAHINVRRMFVSTILITLVAYFLFKYWDNIDYWVFGKLNQNGGSADARFGAVLSNLALFIRKPLLGHGWVNMANQFSSMQTLINTDHNTNTLLLLLSVYGIVTGILMIGGTVLFFYHKRRGVIGIALAVCWILAISNENLSLNVVIYTLAMYGMKLFNRRVTNKYDEAEY